jgi:branched-chain amino acid transport system permease protein
VFQEYEHLMLGLIIIVSMIFMRRGIVPSLSALLQRRARA